MKQQTMEPAVLTAARVILHGELMNSVAYDLTPERLEKNVKDRTEEKSKKSIPRGEWNWPEVVVSTLTTITDTLQEREVHKMETFFKHNPETYLPILTICEDVPTQGMNLLEVIVMSSYFKQTTISEKTEKWTRRETIKSLVDYYNSFIPNECKQGSSITSKHITESMLEKIMAMAVKDLGPAKLRKKEVLQST